MNNSIRIGIAAALLVVAGLVVFFLKGGSDNLASGSTPLAVLSPVTVSGYYGGEKEEFLKNPEVQKILLDKYGITVSARKAGSVEMVRDLPLGPADDFVWPSSQVSLAIYKDRNGVVAGSDNIFNSPMVLYTWGPVVDALVNAKIVEKRNESLYVIDMQKLVTMIADGKRWADIGLNKLNGRMNIRTTDPAFSNGGLIFAGLLASTLNGGEIPDDTTIVQVLPKLTQFFGRLGLMEQSSKDLFQQYLTTGMGAKTIVAGYESQLVEYLLQNPSQKATVLQSVRVLYPEPTVWSSHPFIARTKNGKRLMEALKDPAIQEIAWRQHGFRSGLASIVNDPKDLGIPAMPNRIDAVIDMPSPSVMERILSVLANNSQPPQTR
ncbi:MAG: substrate-binding domain-containing protein [Candidatus Obscuribacter sp.]|nr:substrate-binding domain-containing protein [Candidatus Obscuribacter sp.]